MLRKSDEKLFISDSITENMLHNQTANRLRSRLRSYHNIVVIDVPFHIDSMMPRFDLE